MLVTLLSVGYHCFDTTTLLTSKQLLFVTNVVVLKYHVLVNIVLSAADILKRLHNKQHMGATAISVCLEVMLQYKLAMFVWTVTGRLHATSQ